MAFWYLHMYVHRYSFIQRRQYRFYGFCKIILNYFLHKVATLELEKMSLILPLINDITLNVNVS